MSRKDEHVTYALENYKQGRANDFDEVRLIHHSLGSTDVSLVDISTQIGSIQLSTPFFINAMTGGSEWTKDINGKLAFVAKKTNLAIATGSASAALKDESQWPSFDVMREIHSDGLLFVNLNPNYGPAEAQKVVERLKADALQIHLNAAQEIVMSDGDRDFIHWPHSLDSIIKTSRVDVIVKEVGFGMSQETIKKLIDLKVEIIDISGRGGTNFIQIENDRRANQPMSYLKNWGQSTVESLLEAHAYRHEVDIIASGGIRHPLDMVKAFALGAKAIGVSAVILNSVMNDGVQQTITMIENWQKELKLLLALMGAHTISDLQAADIVLSDKLLNYCKNRKITMTI